MKTIGLNVNTEQQQRKRNGNKKTQACAYTRSYDTAVLLLLTSDIRHPDSVCTPIDRLLLSGQGMRMAQGD